jgi:hypothetical protein
MVANLVIALAMFGTLWWSLVSSIRSPRPRPSGSSATTRPPTHRPARRPVPSFNRCPSWEGVAEVAWHRAPREIATRRDVAERMGLAFT